MAGIENPVILAAQRRTTEAILNAQLRGGKIGREDYDKKMAEVGKGKR